MDDDMTAELANDLRLACQRIARRVRFEGTQAVAPHQFSVLVRVHKQPCTPTALAEQERVSTPSMTRTVNSLVELGLVFGQNAVHHGPGSLRVGDAVEVLESA